MIITCAQCQTRFRVDDGLIKETGTRVRCSNCQNVFTVFHPGSRGEDATLSRGPIPRPPARENPPRTAAGENAGRGRAAEGSRPKTGGDCPGREETGKDATLGLSRPAATRPAAPPETQAAS
ncbi:MAG: zinc-ribbon domain-containing protein, partial [Deltaproteobacteria bacterium]|nr:zinc-ribbon domain-containing protein [Deltaproteobacteria bacterium]